MLVHSGTANLSSRTLFLVCVCVCVCVCVFILFFEKFVTRRQFQFVT